MVVAKVRICHSDHFSPAGEDVDEDVLQHKSLRLQCCCTMYPAGSWATSVVLGASAMLEGPCHMALFPPLLFHGED